jgi:phage baseplate assembly protein gpV
LQKLSNQFPAADTITFDPAVFNTPQTILLTQGQLTITQSVTIDGTIDGAGPSEVSLGITIDAGGGLDGEGNGDGFRIFNISPSAQSTLVEFNSLTLTGGDVSGTGVVCEFDGQEFGDHRKHRQRRCGWRDLRRHWQSQHRK